MPETLEPWLLSQRLLPSSRLRQWSQKSRSSAGGRIVGGACGPEDMEPLVVEPEATAVVQVSTVELEWGAEAAPQEASVKMKSLCYQGSSG